MSAKVIALWTGLFFGLSLGSPSYAGSGDRWSLDALLNLYSYGGNTPQRSWIDGGFGKQRTGSSQSQVIADAAASLRYKFDLRSTVTIDAAYNQDPSDNIGITQAFWKYRPIPRSAWRSHYRLGAFHLPLSFEHSEPMWQPMYTINPAMINTWVGEELRTFGVEGRWSRRIAPSSAHKLTLLAALFVGNDPAGAMLSWRGWASHNRTSIIGDRIELGALPVTEPGALLSEQDNNYEPFKELDGRPGYYLGVDWEYSDTAKIRYLYYDNRGDPLTLVDGQYAWHTRFHHLGAILRPAKRWRIVGQAMTGRTVMGPKAVDNDFGSVSLLASRVFKRSSATLRTEIFWVNDQDFTSVIDPNNENGHRIAISFQFRPSEKLSAGIEASRLYSNRDFRTLTDERRGIVDYETLLTIRYRL